MRISRFFVLQIFCILFLSFFLIQVPNSLADGIKIVPNKLEILVNPGDVKRESIKITNNSNADKVFYLSLRDFKTKGNVGQVEISKGESLLKTWISLPDKGIKFGPKEEKSISFSIMVPKNAGPGGHYGAILIGGSPTVDNQTIEGEQGAIVAVNHQVTSLLLLHVTGDVVEKADVKEFSTDKFFYSTPFKVNFLSRIENIGNVHIKPRGMIQIENMAGEKTATVVINKSGGNILPKTIRNFTGAWDKKFAFGKYTAKLILTYGTPASEGGNGNKTLTSITEFWIMPMKILIPLIGGIIAAILLFMLFFKFQQNKAVKKTLKQMGVANRVSNSRRNQEYSSVKHFFSIFVFFLSIVLFVSFLIYFVLFS